MRPSICTCILALAATATCSSAGAAEEIYRWVDADGVVHYTQVAPRLGHWERVTPGGHEGNRRRPTLDNPRAHESENSASPDAASAEPQKAGETDKSLRLNEPQQAMQQRLEDQAAERLAELEKRRREDCERAREQFQQLTTYARIRVEGEDGGTRVLGEEERQERIAEARDAIVLNCEDEG